MPNIAQVLTGENSRLARKRALAERAVLKRVSTKHRADIAALKRQVTLLTKQVAAARRQRPVSDAARDEKAGTASTVRFSAKRLASHRKRLGLSAAELGRMFGVSGQTIYLWETGRARPRPKHLPAVVALRSMGRRPAVAVLESLPSG